ncbi:methyl-accepting chemotaxis protein [Aquabacterium sp. CECT 9606]|uniref:methyl-accepting chemotaxis protein n=1 Tax=Aquabacterium sp. CECT 9606 TaxID=2845822 RepID=UPI001E5B452E|nr:methyl-accepting chemotaxis protein [Aquabacterium sp. CECT 9606]CAH0351777.1 IS66 family transposase ISPsy43 [Aquabacterium sp. CECT 9606]
MLSESAQNLARPKHAVPVAGGSWEFFRYHGAWAPGVRLFRRIDFKTKALTISLVFAIPLFWLSWQYFGDKAAMIGFSAKERIGVTYARQVMPLVSALQRQRSMALAEAVSHVPPTDLAAVQQQVAALLKRLDAEQQADGATLGTDKPYQDFLEAHRQIASPSAGFDTVWATHTRQLDQLITLLAASTDGSNLTLDPDIDSYYLMDASMFRLPLLSDHLAQLGELGSAMLANSGGTPAQIRRVTELLVLANGQLQAVRDGLDKVYAYNTDSRSQVNADEAMRQISVFLQQAEASLLRPEGPRGNARAHQASALQALEQLAGLTARATSHMDGLIETRVDAMTRARDITTAVMVLCVAAALYLFLSFKKVLDGGLREIASHLNAMREGNLATEPKAWGRDEIAQLIHCVSDMQDSLGGLVQQVRQSSDSLLSGASEISLGSMELSARTEANSASLEQTAASMSAMTQTAHVSADHSRAASDLARDNANAASQGQAIIQQVMTSMNAVKDSSRQIGDIIAVIDGIAFQTNILALNAAVEAARAGDEGKGFAVVAGEVRALSLRSATAAREIKSLITDSMGRVDDSTQVAQSAGKTMGDLVGNAQRMKTLLEEISASARQQNSGITDIGAAVQDLDRSTQQNSALVEETAAAALSMKKLAQQLAERVSMFKVAG